MEEEARSGVRRIAIIGTYVPRQCGIATFTNDLCESIAALRPDATCLALPVNDVPEGYRYPPRARFEIQQNDLAAYRLAGDFLNVSHVEVVSVQHEFGIFGGPAGSHILTLLRELHIPVVTTFHTVLRNPDPHQRHVVEGLARFSDRLVVLSRRAATFLQEIYRIPEERIDFIPHGIPDVPFIDPNFYKDQFGVEGKTVLLTFGLLSPVKGVEHVIEAMPAILEKHPNVVYVILGATHPHVKRQFGEAYRRSLEKLAASRGVSDQVIFHNRFVSLEELIEFIGAADIYITPYLNMEQAASGTLAYALGAGKAVVSTPYWYAQELLEDESGTLVPPADPPAIARAVSGILEDEARRHAMRKKAYMRGREMTWPSVAARYLESFDRARRQPRRRPRRLLDARSFNGRRMDLPDLSLRHLHRLTDGCGILQHAIFNVPNFREGYTTDDNARAVLLAVQLEESGADVPDMRDLAARYLAFLTHAFDPKSARFHNCLSFERHWLDEMGSEDSHGRALSALGAVVGRSNDGGFRGAASRLFEQALPAIHSFKSPRAFASTLLGIRDYLARFGGDREVQDARRAFAGRLMELYAVTASAEWRWFEDVLSYANATLPHALIASGQALQDAAMIETGLGALEWLADIQRAPKGHFMPVGCDGFYPRGERCARFDQQPIEAQTMVSACIEAYRVTGQERWREEARRSFEWFLGRNELGLPLYEPETGACRDGLHPDRTNENRGAESTIAFLQALTEMRMTEALIDVRENLAESA